MWTSSDVSTSYRLAARSQEAVTTCRPPTSQSAAITTPWWLFRVAVATRTVGTSQGPSPSTSPSSLSDESWSSSHGAYGCSKQDIDCRWWRWRQRLPSWSHWGGELKYRPLTPPIWWYHVGYETNLKVKIHIKKIRIRISFNGQICVHI